MVCPLENGEPRKKLNGFEKYVFFGTFMKCEFDHYMNLIDFWIVAIHLTVLINQTKTKPN